MYSSYYSSLDLGSLGVVLFMSAARYGSFILCWFVSSKRRLEFVIEAASFSDVSGGFPDLVVDDGMRR